MVSRFPGHRGQIDHGEMVEALRVVLAVLVVASLVVVATYVLIFFAVAVWTLFTDSRRDPLAEELDEVLAEILGNTPTGDQA